METNKKKKITLKLSKTGKTAAEIANIIQVHSRTVERYQEELRAKGELQNKTGTKKEKTQYAYNEVASGVKELLEYKKPQYQKYQDIYRDIKLQTSWGKDKQVEDQILMLSDLHTGMINKAPITGETTYDKAVEEQELKALIKGVFRFHQLYKPSYNIETLYIFGLGDLITNDRIYEGQVGEITCGVGAQIELTFDYLSDMIKKLLEIYPKIHFIMEYGNHARTTAKPMPEEVKSSFEYMLGLLLKERFKSNKRVEITLPDDYAYSLDIRGHRYLLTHGNSIRGATLNSIEKAVKEISLLVEQEHYSVITMGHFHSCYELPISPSTTLLVNGCFIYKDSYAYYKLRKFSTAKQYLFNVSKKSALHNLQKLDLRW